MAATMQISAKTLGALAMPDFCPRCFWIQMKLAGKLPFQIFPGIFNTLDSYSKRLIQSSFDLRGGPPAWLRDIGRITRSVKPPHYSKFKVTDEQTCMRLTGTPDAIFVLDDGSYAIIDYKTAKFTATQDELFPIYEVQLNAYAYIGERCGFRPVSKLALVYTEPVAGDDAAEDERNLTKDGFLLGFNARILPVRIRPKLVVRLLQLARRVLDSTTPPVGASGCKDCASLKRLLALIT